MKERMESQNAIIFIHELHTLIGAGSAEGSLDAVSRKTTTTECAA